MASKSISAGSEKIYLSLPPKWLLYFGFSVQLHTRKAYSMVKMRTDTKSK